MSQEQKMEIEYEGAEVVVGTGDEVSTGVTYGIKSISGGRYLDGRSKDENDPLLTARDPKNDEYLQWTIIKTKNNNYAIKSKSSGKYLDGRSNNDDTPLLNTKDPNNDKYLQWTFELCNNKNNIAIKSVSSGKYLDGRSPDKNTPLITNRNPKNDEYLQWTFEPQNYKLKVYLSNFDFGDLIDKVLEQNKQIAFVDVKKIIAEVAGLEVSGTYGKSISSSFTWGFSESVGIGVETEIQCGIPLLASGTVKVSANFTFTANQQWTETPEEDFETGYSFKPQSPGIYEVGLTVYTVTNLPLTFKASVTAIAINTKNEKRYSGIAASTMLKHSGSTIKIIKKNDSSVEGIINGKIYATYGVSSEAWSTKIGDIKDKSKSS